jgi:CubicO group peptidase (beta-lactamase class C family)
MSIQQLVFNPERVVSTPVVRRLRFCCAVLAHVFPALPSYGQHQPSISSQQIQNRLLAITLAGADSGAYHTIEERMKALGVPGLSMAVFEDGKISWAKAYGLRDQSPAKPVDTTTLFQAASISKPVTSVAAFKLVEAKVLSLDQDVNLQLRRWKLPQNQFTAQQKVTLRHIVSHTAGLTVHGFAGYLPNAPLPSLVNILEGTPPANSAPVRVKQTPGQQETYSGGGFTILQLLLEEVTGQSFGVLVEGLVLQPIGMKQSTFALPLPPKAMTGRGRWWKGATTCIPN